jgi:vancomycin permeability regulator SanA
LDYAGLDTWDTCLRAAEQFGVERAVALTQHRYAPRTAALCRRAGIDVTVLSVDPPRQRLGARVRAVGRENLAKVKAVHDLVRRPPARHGGPFIGLVGSVDMPPGGHPPDWDYAADGPSE